MAPGKSNAEAWKYMSREPKDPTKLICSLCGDKFTGSLTRVVDHLLSSSNGRGGDVGGVVKK